MIHEAADGVVWAVPAAASGVVDLESSPDRRLFAADGANSLFRTPSNRGRFGQAPI